MKYQNKINSDKKNKIIIHNKATNLYYKHYRKERSHMHPIDYAINRAIEDVFVKKRSCSQSLFEAKIKEI